MQKNSPVASGCRFGLAGSLLEGLSFSRSLLGSFWGLLDGFDGFDGFGMF